MARTTQNLEVANVTIRFGEEKVLLDLFQEVVYPAFFKERRRTFGTTTYFFMGVTMVNLGSESSPHYGIAGRLVKDMLMRRNQVVRNGQLVRDEASIENAPSSLFVLLLENHKLLYVKEEGMSPDKDAFKATLDNFLSKAHKEWIDHLAETHEENRKADPSLKRITRVELFKQFPWPSLKVEFLTSKESVFARIENYDVLERVEIHLYQTNNDIDNDPFFQAVRGRQEAIGSEDTTISHKSKGDGLDKAEAAKQIEAATNLGNAKFKAKGKDKEGNKKTIENKDVQVKAEITGLIPEQAPKSAAKTMFRLYEQLKSSGALKIPDKDSIPSRVISFIKRVL